LSQTVTKLLTCLLIILCWKVELAAQQKAIDSLTRPAKDSIFTYYKRYFQLADSSFLDNPFDSLFSSIDSGVLRKRKIAVPKIPNWGSLNTKQWIKLSNGYINYNWNYRTGIDTPFNYQNISQHHITASTDLTLAGVLPMKVTYFERRSNSPFFRDFRDFRVDVNTYELNRLKTARIRDYINKELMSYVNNAEIGELKIFLIMFPFRKS
jgi:hypothetical protein